MTTGTQQGSAAADFDCHHHIMEPLEASAAGAIPGIRNVALGDALQRFKMVTIRGGEEMYRPGDSPAQMLLRFEEGLREYKLKGTDPLRQASTSSGRSGAPCTGCNPFESMKYYAKSNYREDFRPLEIYGASTAFQQVAYVRAGLMEITAHFTLGPLLDPLGLHAALNSVTEPIAPQQNLPMALQLASSANQESGIDTPPITAVLRLPSFQIFDEEIFIFPNTECIAQKICNMFEKELRDVKADERYSPFSDWSNVDLDAVCKGAPSQTKIDTLRQRLNRASNVYVYLVKCDGAVMEDHIKKSSGIDVLRKLAVKFNANQSLPPGKSIFIKAIAVAKDELDKIQDGD